jgi:hypothetical protein
MLCDIKLSVVFLIVMAPHNFYLELEMSLHTSRSSHDIKAKGQPTSKSKRRCHDTLFNDNLYNGTEHNSTQTNVLYLQRLASSVVMLYEIFMGPIS